MQYLVSGSTLLSELRKPNSIALQVRRAESTPREMTVMRTHVHVNCIRCTHASLVNFSYSLATLSPVAALLPMSVNGHELIPAKFRETVKKTKACTRMKH